MDYSNKHIKEELRQEMPLPEGFAWENMQAGIVQSIELGAVATGSTIKWWWTWKFASALVGFSALFLVGFYTYFQTSEPINDILVIEENTKSIPTSTNTITEIEPSIKTTISKITESVPVSEEVKNKHVKSAKQAINSRLKITKATTTPSPELLKNTDASLEVSEKEHSTRTNTNTTKIAASLTEQAANYTSQLNIKTLENTPLFISSLPSRLPLLHRPDRQLAILSSLSPINKHKNKSHFTFDLSTGINTWKPQYAKDVDFNAKRAASEQSVLGTTAGLSLAYHLPTALFARTGLQWQQLQSRFQYESTESVEVEMEQALVSMNINLISNDTTRTYQDTNIDAAEIRSIQHYNQHQIWSIPLLLGYEWQAGQTSLSLAVGGLFSIKSHSAGRTLYATDVISYDRNTPIHTNAYGLAGVAQLRLQYHLSEGLYIGGEISTTHWLKNWSIEEAIDLQPKATNFTFVLGRKF